MQAVGQVFKNLLRKPGLMLNTHTFSNMAVSVGAIEQLSGSIKVHVSK